MRKFFTDVILHTALIVSLGWLACYVLKGGFALVMALFIRFSCRDSCDRIYRRYLILPRSKTRCCLTVLCVFIWCLFGAEWTTEYWVAALCVLGLFLEFLVAKQEEISGCPLESGAFKE